MSTMEELKELNLELSNYLNDPIYKKFVFEITQTKSKIREKECEIRCELFEVKMNEKISQLKEQNDAARNLETTQTQQSNIAQSKNLQHKFWDRAPENKSIIKKEFLTIFEPIVQQCIGMQYCDAIEYLNKNGLGRVENYTNGGYDDLIYFRTKLFCNINGVVGKGYIEF